MARLDTILRIDRKGQIDSLRIDAVLSESHRRNAEISDFPVETGVVFSDHVQLEPLQVEMECLISDAPATLLGVRSLGDVARNIRNAFIPGRFSDLDEVPNSSSRSPLDAWEYLNRVWQERNLIVVVSSLQVYRNMILTDLTAAKTPEIGQSLSFSAVLREVQILEIEESAFPVFKLKRGATKKRAQGKAAQGKKTTETPKPTAEQSVLRRWLQWQF